MIVLGLSTPLKIVPSLMLSCRSSTQTYVSVGDFRFAVFEYVEYFALLLGLPAALLGALLGR